jgi:UDP-2,3-diacylglucosamine hydrolase
MQHIFFASDFHLGVDAPGNSSREREMRIARWLDAIAPQCGELYLVGDLFDYWFEYRSVVPKGYLRLLGRLANLRDQGVPVTFFTGNHDMWMFRYFEEELGIPVLREPVLREFQGKRFLIGHGDGLGPGDHGYKFIKAVFANRLCQWLFARIHPDTGIALMRYFSGKSRAATGDESQFLGAEKEWLVQFCEEEIKKTEVDYFIFGHRHLPIDHTLSDGRTRYINLGDWLRYNTYAEFDGKEIVLKEFRG